MERYIENIVRRDRKAWISSAHRGFVGGGHTLRENTLGAFYNAFLNGADMVECDARMAADGVLVCCHDPEIEACGVTYEIAATTSAELSALTLCEDAEYGRQGVPTLEQVLRLAYNTGMHVNIDMKNGAEYARDIAELVLRCGMRGRAVYATNGAGADTINEIISLDADARFIDKPVNYTAEKLASVRDYGKRCFAYTPATSSKEVIDGIRSSGCMLALISITEDNFAQAAAQCPDMFEYLHTSDSRSIEENYFSKLVLY